MQLLPDGDSLAVIRLGARVGTKAGREQYALLWRSEEPEAALNDDSPIGEPESVSGQNTVMQDALVKRKDDESWTIVSWTMSKYSGRWLLDALSITEGDSTIFVKKDA